VARRLSPGLKDKVYPPTALMTLSMSSGPMLGRNSS
jgi:hypothetical protein